MSLIAGVAGQGGLPRAFAIPCGRAKPRVSGVWLAGEGGPHNRSPVVLPFPARLVAVSASCGVPGTWDAEVYRNSDVRGGGAPLVGNALAVLGLSSQDAESATMSVELSAGDELGVYLRGTLIERPQVLLWLVRSSA